MKKVLLNTLLVSCLLFVGMISQAKAQQRSIKGKVTDASNGDPLPGANVYITKLNIGAATGVNGTYVISSVPTGTYTVTVTYVGYKKYTLLFYFQNLYCYGVLTMT